MLSDNNEESKIMGSGENSSFLHHTFLRDFSAKWNFISTFAPGNPTYSMLGRIFIGKHQLYDGV